ncbi:ATP-binding SpoIIE family protein phosphatase [Persicimonas caeni]|nr:fused response regulator/phosphatase [Persicimonas caeni]
MSITTTPHPERAELTNKGRQRSDLSQSTTSSRGRVLVAEDTPSERMVLRRLIEREGFEVVEATDGVEALELFAKHRFDLVLLDGMMPRRNGFEIVGEIKEMSGERFVPVIFVTGMDHEDALIACIEHGGDDVITKPFSHPMLRAKIGAMERIRDLYRERLQLSRRIAHDSAMAQQIYERAIFSGNIAVDRLQTWFAPAELFSGDVMLSAFRPDGGLDLLLGDFTGHGMAAAIGALPVADTFRHLSSRGASPAAIMEAIDERVHAILPVEMFFSACFVSLSAKLDHVDVWNAGMPDVLVVDRDGDKIKARATSRQIALGIQPIGRDPSREAVVERIPVHRGDRVVMYTDGVIEAANEYDEFFGQARLESAIVEARSAVDICDHIERRVTSFQAGRARDDIGLVVLGCEPWAVRETSVSTAGPERAAQTGERWQWQRLVRGVALARTDPVAEALESFQAESGAEGCREELSVVECIVNELYSNAVNHGVLGISGGLRSTADGFARYYATRKRRLSELDGGWVQLSMSWEAAHDHGGKLRVVVEDSGNGFDYRRLDRHKTSMSPGQHGLTLVRELCDTLRFSRGGRRVEATYWYECECDHAS